MADRWPWVRLLLGSSLSAGEGLTGTGGRQGVPGRALGGAGGMISGSSGKSAEPILAALWGQAVEEIRDRFRPVWASAWSTLRAHQWSGDCIWEPVGCSYDDDNS